MFGNRFNHCDVKAFRSTATRVDGTVAEIEVVFNEANTTADLPTNALVVQTFVLAVNDSSNNFTVAINPNNVQVISSPVTDPNTVSTAAPTTTVTTTAATSATVAPTTAAITTTLVTFRSRLDKFTNDLNDPSSEPFIKRSANITTQLQPRYQNAFPSSFKDLNVVGYRNGSIYNDLKLAFVGTSVPNNTQIAHVLMNAAPYVTGFDIEAISILVNGIPSSGVTYKISVMTAFFLVLLSWLLSNQQ
ncbi:hypothetical protein Q5P01_000111 [Channa striata]|uniref:SEA domain-containing protein n=1 Tax=Channa striata TaxID=64152 RepID=A0AA88LFY7_CHASR|nr:hypothetical protein Q5P01_000111 [Channa striata]